MVSLHDIVNARAFLFPLETVFSCFSDPVRLAQWWGPAGFTNEFQVFEFHPGGAWRFIMHGPDGAAFAMNKQFADVVPPERIVLRHFQQTHDFVLTMTFTAQKGGTMLTWRMSFDDPAEAEKLRPVLLTANEQNFDRLAAHLAASLSVANPSVR